MLTSLRPLLVGALLAAHAIGCAPATRPPPFLGGEPGVTKFLLVNHVAPPLRLERVTLSIDGNPVSLATLPPSSDDVAIVARAPSISGEHALTLLATAGTSGARDAGVVVLDSSRGYRVQGGAAVVRIELVATSDGLPMIARISAEGAALEPSIDGPAPDPTDEQRCLSMLPIPRAMCRAQVAIAVADRTHDPVLLACVRDKLDRMQLIAEKLSRTPADDAQRSAESRLRVLGGDVDRCADVNTTMREDGLTVVRVAR